VTPRFAHLAVISALAAALALGGCGRKGPLDPPPGPGAENAPAAKPAAPGLGLSPAAADKPAQPSVFNRQGKPTPIGPGPKRALPMDWLIE
jgi:predicted small lipoprotein YifL